MTWHDMTCHGTEKHGIASMDGHNQIVASVAAERNAIPSMGVLIEGTLVMGVLAKGALEAEGRGRGE